MKRTPSIKRQLPTLIVATIAAIALGIGVFFIVRAITAPPVSITLIETTNALSSRVENPEIKNTFTSGEPIMLYFEYDHAKTGTNLAYEIRDDIGTIQKSGHITSLRVTDDDPQSGNRYISIINTGTAVLPKDTYQAVLLDGNRPLKTLNFKVE